MYSRKTKKKQQDRVALYARVSSEMQVEEGVSIEAQLAEMREFALNREWKIASEFVDGGVSGRTFERPGMQTLLTTIRQGSIDIVLVHELSRLSRTSVSETFAIFDILGDAGIGFASVKEPMFDLSTPTGRLMLSMISAMNQYYVDMLIMHTKKSKRHRARQGLYNSSIAPYGYRPTENPRQPPEIYLKEVEAIRLIFEHYATGNYSFQNLADLLNDRTFRTRQGNRFSKDTIADMIRNPFYAGHVVYKEGKRGEVGEVFDGQHEPIISHELWERCRQVRHSKRYTSKETSSKERPYLLGKLARCHICNRSLRSQTTGSGPFYREMSYSRGYDDCPHSRKGARATSVHAQMTAIVNLLKLPDDWQQEIDSTLGDSDETRALHQRRNRLKMERRRLKEAYIRGDFEEDVDIYRRELARIRRELEQVPNESDLAQIQHAAVMIGSMHDVWADATEEEQRDLLKLILHEADVDVINNRLVWFKPRAPFVPLFRRIPILQERRLGQFTPIWPPVFSPLLSYPALSPVTHIREDAPALPFLATWPWTVKEGVRITKPLSTVLKERRKLGYSGGRCVEAPHEGVPSQQLDTRKWPCTTLETLSLEQILTLPPDTMAFVTTPLQVQGPAHREQLVSQMYELLAPQGCWHFVDLMPSSVPAHWLFQYFTGLWEQVADRYWDSHTLYNALRKSGFHVVQRERMFYQAVSQRTALRIARRRPTILAALPDKHYAAGLARLEEMVEKTGGEILIGSEVALVDVQAIKGKPWIGRKGEGKSRKRK